MVYLVPFLGAAALLSNLVLAVPTPGSGSSSKSDSSSVSSSASFSSSSSASASASASSSSASSSSECSGNGCGSFGNVSESNSSSSNSSCDGGSCDSSNSCDGGSCDSSNSCYGDSCDSVSTSTSTAYKSYNTPMYGSGSNYNNYGSGYDDCVSQCIAQFGGDAYTYTPTSTSESSDYSSTASVSSGGDSGSMGTNGVTHTVIVAPTAGVFRYVPFALNASVGDTIEFQWGADMHTVTHSSELLPCNKTADSPFTSGVQNKGFVYHQAVTTTDPVFYYCGIPTHCQKGMFGIINPPVNLMAPTSVGNMMQDMIASSDDLKTYAMVTASKVGDLGPGATWGNAIDIGNMTADNQADVVSNVLYTRNVLGMNAPLIWNNQTNAIDLSPLAQGSSLMLPPDVGAALAQADVTSQASTSSTASVAGATDSASAPSASATGKSNSGAGALASPKMLVAFVAIAATVLAL